MLQLSYVFHLHTLKTPPDSVTIFAFNCHTFFKGLKRRRAVYYVYQMFTISITLPLFPSPSFFLTSFPFRLNFPQNFLYSSSASSKSFYFSSEDVFILPSLIQNTFIPCLPDCSLLSALENNIFPVLLAPMVSSEEPTSIRIAGPYR